MKKLSKVLVLVLSAIMVLAMSASVFAGTIEVQDVLDGETYTAYKILNYTNNGDAYSYYLTSEEYASIGAVLREAGLDFTASADGSQYYVNNAEALTESGVSEVAAALAESLDDLGDALGKFTAVGANGEAVFTDLPTGYYFVTSSAGSLCALHDDREIATVVEKNTMVSDEKTVDAASESLQVGDTATYTITLTDGKGTNLAATLTDTMSAGLTYNDDAVVTVPDKSEGADEGATKALVEDTDYTVSITGGEGSPTVVVYTFTPAVMTALEENDQIVVTYTATLNQYASLDGTETNTEFTKYSKQETNGNTVDVKDYNLTIQKKANSVEGDSLKGAQFALYRDDATAALNVVAITVEDPAANTVYYRVAAEGETGATTVIDMEDAYEAVIYGLDGDSTYYIEETKAPDGYNKLDERIAVEMGDTNKVQPVVNNAGSVLPSTGGIGTTIFYILGSALVIGCGIVLISRKRMQNK